MGATSLRYEFLSDIREKRFPVCVKGDVNEDCRIPTVVLVGGVGVGKSSLVEKVTGAQRLGSGAAESYVRSSAFRTPCQKMQLIDTPGINAARHDLPPNVCIAEALSFAPISLILLVVKADVRIDSTIDAVTKHAELFSEFCENLCVIITHMDTVSGWGPEEAAVIIKDELGIEKVLCVSKDDRGAQITQDICNLCPAATLDFREKHDKLWQLLPTSYSHVKISKCVQEEVKRFKQLVERKAQELGEQPAPGMSKTHQELRCEMEKGKKRVTADNQFKFDGANAALEKGYIADLTSQLQQVLKDGIAHIPGESCEPPLQQVMMDDTHHISGMSCELPPGNLPPESESSDLSAHCCSGFKRCFKSTCEFLKCGRL